MLTEALNFPTSGDRGAGSLLVGSALLLVAAVAAVAGSVLPPLLLVALLVQIPLRGYYVRVLRATALEPDPATPSFADPRALVSDGVIAVGVGLAYLLPAGLFFLVALGGSLAAVPNPSAVGDPTTVSAVETVGGLAALLGIAAFAVGSYLVPGAITLFAAHGERRAAFDLRTVLRGTATEDYAVGWLLTVVLQLVCIPLAVAMYPLLVGFVLHFLVAVAVRYVWGTAFGAGAGIGPSPDAADGTGSREEPAAWGSTSGRVGESATAPVDRDGDAGSPRGPGGDGQRSGPVDDAVTRDPMAEDDER